MYDFKKDVFVFQKNNELKKTHSESKYILKRCHDIIAIQISIPTKKPIARLPRQ